MKVKLDNVKFDIQHEDHNNDFMNVNVFEHTINILPWHNKDYEFYVPYALNHEYLHIVLYDYIDNVNFGDLIYAYSDLDNISDKEYML